MSPRALWTVFTATESNKESLKLDEARAYGLDPHSLRFLGGETKWESSTFALEHGLGQVDSIVLDEELTLSKAFSTAMRPSKIIPYFYRASNEFEPDDITVTTLVTSSRFGAFSRLIDRHQGPISVTIHVGNTTHEIRAVLRSLRSLYTTSRNMATYVDVHLVIDSFDRQFNTWRNIARLFARTDYIMMLDVDFYLCTDLRTAIRNSRHIMDKLSGGNAALVIPAFEYTKYSDGLDPSDFPRDKRALLNLVKSKRLGMFHASWIPGHNGTDYKRFYAAPPGDIYKVTQYTSAYEPCDERFIGYGGNKAACLFEMYISGISFFVLADHFIIHQSHRGRIVWAHNDVEQLLGDIAEVVYLDSKNRSEFLAAFQPGGKYDDVKGIYRENGSTDIIGTFDKEIIFGLSASVKWIAHNGAGYDPVDVHACIERGIYLSNTPGAVDDATATTALYLLISTLRQYSISERSLRAGQWKPFGLSSKTHDITGRTLAILGLGGIGLRFAQLAHAFPMRIVYHSRHKVQDAPKWCEYFENVDEMLAQADVLSVHVPLRADTVGLVGEKMIRALKPGAIIINTARGRVIDEEAMIRALEDGHLTSVGLDVFPNEPEVNPRLLEFPNITLLPHMGTETQDSQRKMEVRALQNLRDYLTTGMGKDLVPEWNNAKKSHPQSTTAVPAPQHISNSDVAKLANGMKDTLIGLETNLRTFNEQSANAFISGVDPSMVSAWEDISAWVKSEIALQVRKQVNEQIREYIPVPLQQQVSENKKQIFDIKISLLNSKARARNSTLKTTNLDEPLMALYKLDGNKSNLYPADLRSLFAYDLDTVKELVKDFGMEADDHSLQEESSPLSQVTQAYRKLSHSELVLFLKVRNLPTTGSDADLASRLGHHDIHTYHFPSTPTKQQQKSPLFPTPKLHKSCRLPGLPIEILADILNFVGDWELAKAVGIHTSIPQPPEWSRASTTDIAMLPGCVPLIRAADPCSNPPTKVGAVLAVRFGYVKVLEYFLSTHHSIFQSIFKDDLIPIKASRHGRTDVLSWWKHGFEQHPHLIPPPTQGSVAEAIDGASRNGQVVSLDWWLNWGRPLEYTEAALEQASAKNRVPLQQHKLTGLPLKIGRVMEMASTAGHVQVLEWWAASRLEPKYDHYAMQHASCHGKVEVLEWWLRSGLQVKFDHDALTGATRHNRPEVLEWWDKSGLPIPYRLCDVEEALEDAIGGGEDARAWWKRKGIDFNANDKEWMKSQSLN
ncbi:hypothetical protein C0995_000928 [Termitomyces sp. Mi166|nr:hypothetical protein C0995_000928 [Termitomyces sp. Mi166\